MAVNLVKLGESTMMNSKWKDNALERVKMEKIFLLMIVMTTGLMTMATFSNLRLMKFERANNFYR
jgi:hypothetical protein